MFPPSAAVSSWARAYDTADGALLWQVDLLAEGGINQFVNSQ